MRTWVLGGEGRVDGSWLGCVGVEEGLGDDVVRGFRSWRMALAEFHVLAGLPALGAAALVGVFSGCEGQHGCGAGKIGFGCAHNRSQH